MVCLTALGLSVLFSAGNALYLPGKPSPASNATLPGNWTYAGCYSDNNPMKALVGPYFPDNSTMNATSCIRHCADKGYTFAGTEYGEQCFCGSQIDAHAVLKPESACSMGCAANKSEACGGQNFLSVYHQANKAAPVANPGPPGWKSHGCWTDGPMRTLSRGMVVEGGAANMSVAGCTRACAEAGFSLAGVEFGQECSCDSKLATDSTRQAPLTECHMLCTGNSSEFCGAPNRLNLYAAGSTVPSTTTTTRKAPAPPLDWNMLGCFSDSVEARTLPHLKIISGPVTVEGCVSACEKANYTLAGLEYADQCYCGDKIREDGPLIPAGRCNMACAGNGGETCGGANAINIYARVEHHQRHNETHGKRDETNLHEGDERVPRECLNNVMPPGCLEWFKNHRKHTKATAEPDTSHNESDGRDDETNPSDYRLPVGLPPFGSPRMPSQEAIEHGCPGASGGFVTDECRKWMNKQAAESS